MADQQPFDPLDPARRAPERDDSVGQQDRKARLLWTQSRTFTIAPRGPETALMSLPPSTAIDVFVQYKQPASNPTITSPDGREVFNLYAGEQLMTRILTSFTPGGHTPGGGGNDLPAVGRIMAIRDFPVDGWELKIDTTAMVPDPDAAPTLVIDVICQGWAREPTGIGPRELETIVAGEEQTDALVVAVATAGLSDVDVPAFALVSVYNLIDPWEPTNQDKAGAQNVIMCGVNPDLEIQPIATTLAGNIQATINTTGLATEAKQDTEITRIIQIGVQQTDGTAKTQQVDAGGNVAPVGDTVARAPFVKLTDGTNTAAVKAASTAPVAADPAEVVSLSPNGNTVQPGTTTAAPAVQDLSLGTTSATQFASAACTRGVYIEALSTNTVSVYVGPSGVTTGTGLELQAGDREFFPTDNANRFYAITGTTTQHLRLLAI